MKAKKTHKSQNKMFINYFKPDIGKAALSITISQYTAVQYKCLPFSPISR